MTLQRNRTVRLALLPVLLSFCVNFTIARAANWTKVATVPPHHAAAGTMLQLTDGTIMIQDGGSANWLRLTPDATGSYIAGTWTSNPINPMSTNRLYFASQVLPNGKVWVLGGEYYGPVLNAVWTSTGEIWDPVANIWSPIAAFPPQACFPVEYTVAGDLTSGSATITNLPSTVTPTFQPGWKVSGNGIPAKAKITSVDSATQIEISSDASVTKTGADLAFIGTPASCYGDDPSILLPGGKILTGSLVSKSTYIYDIASDTFSLAANKVYNDSSDEEGWTKLTDGRILTYDIFQSIASKKGYAEVYDPVNNVWSSASPADGSAVGTLPLLSSKALGYELGPQLRLFDGRAFVAGADGKTALYDPSANSWAAGPKIMGSLNGTPVLFGSDDAPSAMLPNGHIILAADAGPSPVMTTGKTTSGSNVIAGIASTATIQIGWPVSQTSGTQVIPFGAFVTKVRSATQVEISQDASGTASGIGVEFGGTFSSPTQLFDFDPRAKTVVPVSPSIPDPNLTDRGAYLSRMLMLPTGQLLFSDGSSQLWVYTPDGTGPKAMLPDPTGVAYNGGGVFTLTGLRLTGMSAGAAYGDDAQMDENYPIVRLVDASGNVSYCRTTNWSSVGVGNSSNSETVDFTLNSAVSPGDYSLIVSAAGLSSEPMPITITQGEVDGQ